MLKPVPACRTQLRMRRRSFQATRILNHYSYCRRIHTHIQTYPNAYCTSITQLRARSTHCKLAFAVNMYCTLSFCKYELGVEICACSYLTRRASAVRAERQRYILTMSGQKTKEKSTTHRYSTKPNAKKKMHHVPGPRRHSHHPNVADFAACTQQNGLRPAQIKPR